MQTFGGRLKLLRHHYCTLEQQTGQQDGKYGKDHAYSLLAKGHEDRGGCSAPPGRALSQPQQPLCDLASMAPSAIEGTNDDGINLIAVHIVWLDLQPGAAAVIHLPQGVQSLDNDALLLQPRIMCACKQLLVWKLWTAKASACRHGAQVSGHC